MTFSSPFQEKLKTIQEEPEESKPRYKLQSAKILQNGSAGGGGNHLLIKVSPACDHGVAEGLAVITPNGPERVPSGKEYFPSGVTSVVSNGPEGEASAFSNGPDEAISILSNGSSVNTPSAICSPASFRYVLNAFSLIFSPYPVWWY